MFESDHTRRQMLKAVGGCSLRIRGEPITALFISESEPIELNGVMVESHSPLLICNTADVKRIEVMKDDPVEGLPEDFRVKSTDNGDKSVICRGQWAGFHTIELKR